MTRTSADISITPRVNFLKMLCSRSCQKLPAGPGTGNAGVWKEERNRLAEDVFHVKAKISLRVQNGIFFFTQLINAGKCREAEPVHHESRGVGRSVGWRDPRMMSSRDSGTRSHVVLACTRPRPCPPQSQQMLFRFRKNEGGSLAAGAACFQRT